MRAIKVCHQSFLLLVLIMCTPPQFYIPAILQEGWALYIWDMLSRIIHIIDPATGPRGCNADQKDRHELIASRLHDALFLRLNDYFAGWPTPKENWTTKYPLLMQNPVTRYHQSPAA